MNTSFGSVGGIHTGVNGFAGATGTSTLDSGFSVQIDSRNRYVVSGNSRNAAAGYQLAVWRYSENGTLDTSFGTSGVATWPAAPPRHVAPVA